MNEKARNKRAFRFSVVPNSSTQSSRREYSVRFAENVSICVGVSLSLGNSKRLSRHYLITQNRRDFRGIRWLSARVWSDSQEKHFWNHYAGKWTSESPKIWRGRSSAQTNPCPLSRKRTVDVWTCASSSYERTVLWENQTSRTAFGSRKGLSIHSRTRRE